jgi:hypothetical protein
MIKKGVIWVLVLTGLVLAGRKPAGLAIFRKRGLDAIYHSCRRPDPGKFLVKPVESKGGKDLPGGSGLDISNPFGRAVQGSSTVAVLAEEKKDFYIPLPEVFHIGSDYVLQDRQALGRVSVWLGRVPIAFVCRKNLWLGRTHRSEYVSADSRMIENFHLLRQVGVDSQGRCFVAMKLSWPGKAGGEPRERLGKNLHLKVDGFAGSPDPWRIWIRLPNGEVNRPDQSRGSFDCDLSLGDKKGDEIFWGIQWAKGPAVRTSGTGREEIEFEFQMTKSNPVTHLQTAGKKEVLRLFPGWDCPEPWLNKLWAGQVFTIQSQMSADPTTGLIRLGPDSGYSLRLVWDARWLRDGRIALGTVLCELDRPVSPPGPENLLLMPAVEALLAGYPEPGLKKIFQVQTHGQKLKYSSFPDPPKIGESYDDFVAWCRSFYVKGDFDHVVDLSVAGDGKTLETRLPTGVIDTVVTKIIGLQADGSDRVRIRPVSWIDHWPYFAIDNLPYRGHNLTVVWQSPGKARRYPDLEFGLNVFIDGTLVKQAPRLQPVELELK